MDESCQDRVCSGKKEGNMKSRTLMCITAIILFAALAIPVQLAAQHTRYKLIDISTFGGPESYVNPAGAIGSPSILNSSGVVVGGAGTSIPLTMNSSRVICGGVEGFPWLGVNHAL